MLEAKSLSENVPERFRFYRVDENVRARNSHRAIVMNATGNLEP